MRQGTKAALKAATRTWEQEQQRYARTEDIQAAKIRFLEDVVRAYQEECEFLIDASRRSTAEIEKGIAREVDVVMDRNRSLALEVKRLQDSVQMAKKEKEEIASKLTLDFERLMERQQERHTLQVTTLQRENETLASRVAMLEQTLKEKTTLERAEAAVVTAEQKYAMDDLQVQISDHRSALAREQAERLRLEEELSATRHHLKKAATFLSALTSTVDRVHGMTRRAQSHHVALVEDLLEAASSAEESFGQTANGGGGSGGDAGGGPSGARSPRAANRRAQMTHNGLGASDDGLGAVERATLGSSEASRRDASGAATTASGSSSGLGGEEDVHSATGILRGGGGASSSPVPPPPATGLNKSEVAIVATRFAAVVDKLEATLEAQQVELALAVRCANEMHVKHVAEAKEKLTSNYAHCQLLLSRIGELERGLSEARDHAQAERDKALNQRDQALLQLRSREARERKIVRHVETQTMGLRIEKVATLSASGATGVGGGSGTTTAAGTSLAGGVVGGGGGGATTINSGLMSDLAGGGAGGGGFVGGAKSSTGTTAVSGGGMK